MTFHFVNKFHVRNPRYCNVLPTTDVTKNGVCLTIHEEGGQGSYLQLKGPTLRELAILLNPVVNNRLSNDVCVYIIESEDVTTV
jgi:hypothetical protein